MPEIAGKLDHLEPRVRGMGVQHEPIAGVLAAIVDEHGLRRAVKFVHDLAQPPDQLRHRLFLVVYRHNDGVLHHVHEVSRANMTLIMLPHQRSAARPLHGCPETAGRKRASLTNLTGNRPDRAWPCPGTAKRY